MLRTIPTQCRTALPRRWKLHAPAAPFAVLLLFLVVGCVVGCGGIRPDVPRTPSTAFQNHRSTALGRMVDSRAAEHPGKSGFEIIRYGHRALDARIAMIGLAEESLDLQYYLWHQDEVGRLMSSAVLDAADRGVRVRVLLDDMGLEGRDAKLAALDAHPNIEIRIFNPFPHRGFHPLGFLTSFDRVNHRMHNKLIVADNSLAIIGGRNIGNHYFGAGKEDNFRDLDAIAAGPVVRDASKVFDYFWNGEWAVPVAALAGGRRDAGDLEEARRAISREVGAANITRRTSVRARDLRAHIRALLDGFTWAKGQIVWDDPKQMRLAADLQKNTMLRKLRIRAGSVEKSLYIESPYFIPGKHGTETLVSLAKRGADVRILTNSFRANDVLPTHAGYSKYRKQLVENGVDLHELRPDAAGGKIIDRHPSSSEARLRSGLHAKTLVFDGKDVFIGSFNLDPRSASINTETGLYIESPVVARKVMAFMDEAVKPRNSYHVVAGPDGHLVWITETDGKREVFTSEPNTGFLDRLEVGLMRALPLESQL